MYIKSFIDVLTTDPSYKGYAIFNLMIDHDPASFDPMEYICEGHGQGGQDFRSSLVSLKDVIEFRGRFNQCLKGLKNIILIDQMREIIFSNINEDPFFERLAKNVSNGNFRLETIPEGAVEEIVKAAFPDPKPEELGKCIIV